VQEEPVPGSILFITSTHTDLTLNRALLTLWMDLAVNALMGMPRTRDLRMWYLFDEVHALHRMPAIEHGLQTARGFGGAFVLGMHSFDKLAETYGEEGAINLASLARTKLILATADKNTAEVCSNFIGFREVRETDEAYSIGASRSRDAATITPRTEVKPLVIPDDIMNLPSLHGYVKFPEGFPAARIRLVWRDYPKIAEPFLRKTDMQLAAYAPPGKAMTKQRVRAVMVGQRPLGSRAGHDRAGDRISELDAEAERLSPDVMIRAR
jgi:type IV secretory pathway TraG/TraD family ATPase VirD4